MSLLDDIKAKIIDLEQRAEQAEHTILSEFLYVLGLNNHSDNPDSEAPVEAATDETDTDNAPADESAEADVPVEPPADVPASSDPQPTETASTPVVDPVPAPVEVTPETPAAPAAQ